MNKTKVLFLCTGNTARSQMAEAFLRKYAPERFEAYSAGLQPGEISPYTRQVMEEIGVDMSDHYSKGVEQFLGQVHFGYLITVCDHADQNCPVFPGLGVRLHWSFEDPAAFSGSPEARLEKFRQVRDRIDQCIQSWLKDL